MKTIYKKTKTVLMLIFAMALTLSSCEYGDTNNNPTRPNGESLNPGAIMPIMQTQSHRNITAGLGRLSGIIMQQWIGFDAQQVAYTSYVITENDVNNFWNGGIYTGAMRDLSLIHI